MKKHLDLEVTGLTALSQQQFPEYHETPLRDFGFEPLHPAVEADYRRNYRYVALDSETRRVPHSRIRAGQEVVSTTRAQDMAVNGVQNAREPVQGRELPTGEIMLLDGHHRVVADKLRGRKTSVVHVGGRWEKP